MTLVCQSIVLLELTQCSNITASKKNPKKQKTKNPPASTQRKKPKPISSMETCFCIWLHGLLLLKKTAVSGTPGWWHWNYTHAHTKINSWAKPVEDCARNLPDRGREGKAFTLLCNPLCSQVFEMQTGLDTFLVPVSLLAIFEQLPLKVLI